MSGRVLNGKYELQQQIAETRRFTVHQGVEKATGTPVVIKMLAEDLAGQPAQVKLFTDEVRQTARLDHAALVPVLDLDQIDGVPYVVSPVVEGVELRTWLRQTQPEFSLLVRLLGVLASLLEAAAAAGIAERTVRLSNLVLTNNGELRLLGFSQSRFQLAEREHAVTERGLQADLFFLGTLAFEFFVGCSPMLKRGGINDAWDEQLRSGLRMRHQNLPPEQIEAVVQILDRAFTRTLARRYATPTVFTKDLDGVVGAIGGRAAVAQMVQRREQSLQTASEVVAALAGSVGGVSATAAGRRRHAGGPAHGSWWGE